MRGEIGNAALACLVQYRLAFGGRADLHAAGILRVSCNIDKAAAREPGHDAAHGWRLDLLGSSQFAERLRTAEHQDRECRKAGWAFSSGNILLAHAAKQMDRSRVQAVGNGYGFRPLASGSWLPVSAFR